jgi:adenine-specific DNA-methyltransferase
MSRRRAARRRIRQLGETMDLDNEKQFQNKIKRLEREVDRLKKAVKQKKYGLVWMDVPEAFDKESENKLPILKEIPEKAIINDDGKPTHILIEGDNYHALTCLNYTHKGKIDIIYIDPPYNTGDDGFRYRDKRILDKFPDGTLVPKDHPLRHSYWLSFMSKRLTLAKELLKKQGVIFLSINEEELSGLKLLCDSIFSESNYLACFTIKVRHEDRILKGDKDFHEVVEYLLMYKKSNEFQTIKKIRDNTSIEEYQYEIIEKQKPKQIQIAGRKVEVFEPGQYEIIKGVADKRKLKRINIRGTLRSGNSSGRFYVANIEPIGHNQGYLYKVPDIGADGIGHRYFLSPAGKRKNGDYFQGLPLDNPETKEVPYPNYFDFEIDFNNVGYEGGVHFRNGKKPINFLRHLLKISSKNKKALILDFFAGSGSTAEAVLQENEFDTGRRQVFLVTNNEANIMDQVCYKRILNIVNGYEMRTTPVDGLKNSFKYYQTAFIGKNNILKATDEDKIELAHQAGDLLALAENTLYKVKENKFWQLYENSERYTAVYFREELDKFDEFVAMVEKLEYPATVYVFSWGDDEFDEEFDHINDVKVKTIPLPILEIYKNIYNVG